MRIGQRGDPVTVTRRVLLRTGLVAGCGIAVGGTGESRADPAEAFSDDFTAVPDGPLDGRRSPTGHVWRTYGADQGPAMMIGGHAIGPPAGHVPDAPGDGAAVAGYASITLTGAATRVTAEYRWDPSTSSATGLALGAFHYGTAPVPGGGPTGATMHLAINPTAIQFAVFSRGARQDFTALTPLGATSAIIEPPTPQVRDGHTIYRAAVHRAGDVARVDVTGLPGPLYFRDPRIASVPAASPFFEYYSRAGGTDLPRFTTVAADRG